MDALSTIAGHPLDQNSSVPLYLQLEERILQLIATHSYDGGEPLPAETDICSALGLSRATVRRCFQDLVDQGRVTRRRGQGTFVSRSSGERGVDVALNFSARMKAKGKEPTSRLVSFRRAHASSGVARQLRLPEGEDVWEIRRLRLSDDEPMELNTAYVAIATCPGLSKKDLEGSLYAHLAERSGILPASAEEYIDAVALDAAEARLLGQRAGMPAFRTLRTTVDASGRPFEVAVIVSRSDRTRLHVVMGGSGSTFSVV